MKELREEIFNIKEEIYSSNIEKRKLNEKVFSLNETNKKMDEGYKYYKDLSDKVDNIKSIKDVKEFKNLNLKTRIEGRKSSASKKDMSCKTVDTPPTPEYISETEIKEDFNKPIDERIDVKYNLKEKIQEFFLIQFSDKAYREIYEKVKFEKDKEIVNYLSRSIYTPPSILNEIIATKNIDEQIRSMAKIVLNAKDKIDNLEQLNFYFMYFPSISVGWLYATNHQTFKELSNIVKNMHLPSFQGEIMTNTILSHLETIEGMEKAQIYSKEIEDIDKQTTNYADFLLNLDKLVKLMQPEIELKQEERSEIDECL
jgi:hypothetical protein